MRKITAILCISLVLFSSAAYPLGFLAGFAVQAIGGWVVNGASSMMTRGDTSSGYTGSTQNRAYSYNRASSVSGSLHGHAFSLSFNEKITPTPAQWKSWALAGGFVGNLKAGLLGTVGASLIAYGITACNHPGGWCVSTPSIGYGFPVVSVPPSGYSTKYSRACELYTTPQVPLVAAFDSNGYLVCNRLSDGVTIRQVQLYAPCKNAFAAIYGYKMTDSITNYCSAHGGLSTGFSEYTPATNEDIAKAVEQAMSPAATGLSDIARAQLAQAIENASTVNPWNDPASPLNLVVTKGFQALEPQVTTSTVDNGNGTSSIITSTSTEVSVSVVQNPGASGSIGTPVISPNALTYDGPVGAVGLSVTATTATATTVVSGGQATTPSVTVSQPQGIDTSVTAVVPGSQAQNSAAAAAAAAASYAAANPSSASSPTSDLCKTNPTASACATLGTTADVPFVTESKPVSITPASSFFGSGSCPAPKALSLSKGGAYSLSYQPICDFMTALKPIVLGAASITAVMIFVGANKKD